jgi:hypothetical protein
MYYKPVFVEGYNGKYIAIPVDVYDENGEVDEEKLAEDVNVLLEGDDANKIYVVENENGMMYQVFASAEDLNLAFVDHVVEALLTDGVYKFGERSEYRLIILDV